jgi:hypothetical protein
MIDAFHALYVDAQLGCDRAHTMVQVHQAHHLLLVEERETGVVAGKGHLSLELPAALFILVDGQAAMDETAVLEQLEMLPGALIIAMDSHTFGFGGFVKGQIQVNPLGSFVFFQALKREGGRTGSKSLNWSINTIVCF